MTARIKRIEIDWKDLFKPIHGLEAAPEGDDLINHVVVKPEVIPIIFIPGIMGSRLRVNNDKTKAWDPDSKCFMVNTYARSCKPSKRKKILIGGQSHAENYLEVSDSDYSKKVPKDMAQKGWGGVAWSFYGDILKAMADYPWPTPLNACFEFPVYAFGYNWSATNDISGKKLAEYIDQVISENAALLPCKQVILVTHSMGGLVARSACKLHGAESKVLGVVHGVQPATGAPAAYFRMKNGFEPPGSPTGKFWDWLRNPLKMIGHKGTGTVSRRVLGKSGEDVTIIMANSPGALELLPNKLYKTNKGSGQWLQYNDYTGKTEEFPKSDPYAEIYKNREDIYRLVDPEWLGDNAAKYKGGYDQKDESPWEGFIENLNTAKVFHKKLKKGVHPETFQFYSTGIKTSDKVEIKCNIEDKEEIYIQSLRVQYPPQGFYEVVNEKGEKQDTMDLCLTSLREHGMLKDSRKNDHEIDYNNTMLYAYTIAEPEGSGDGTVPDSSGRALSSHPTGYTHGPDGTVSIGDGDESWFNRQHDGVYDTKKAQRTTLKAIENLCKTKIKKEVGI